MYTVIRFAVIGSLFASAANAHICLWHRAMYAFNGTTGKFNPNAGEMVSPLYKLDFKDFWNHHLDNCDQFPPADGDFLELPAGGKVTVELAMNRAFTSYSYNGTKATAWPDGKDHPDDYSITNLGGFPLSGSGCLSTPNLHTQNESNAAGTVLAISYTSVLSEVTPENLVVISVASNTPWKRFATYFIPAKLPSCPTGGCICIWSWVPNGCGQPNIYLEPLRCMVTGTTSKIPLAAPKPPVWCEDDKFKCVKGAKQVVIWNQNERNNINISGTDLSGHWKSPGYNNKLGFDSGAQNDVFASGSTTGIPSSSLIAAPSSTVVSPSTVTSSLSVVASSQGSISSSSNATSSRSTVTSAHGTAAFPPSASPSSPSTTAKSQLGIVSSPSNITSSPSAVASTPDTTVSSPSASSSLLSTSPLNTTSESQPSTVASPSTGSSSPSIMSSLPSTSVSPASAIASPPSMASDLCYSGSAIQKRMVIAHRRSQHYVPRSPGVF